ncbi:MAG: anaerobic ribonucleoside-triphosphate reductase activating protein [Candidatus Omnitrophota bacterium]|nr:anaerobic ribonucleoside-triphosphate reductase activating protein [Candidatus Omnitrophota bacterium]
MYDSEREIKYKREVRDMKIAGLQKVSMVDYPGYICATVFTQGCNFRCGFCHNRDLITTEKDPGFSKQEIFEYFNSRKTMIEGVCITGGEPTLWPDLPDFARKVKETGLKFKLDTNGSNPQMIGQLLQEGLLDYIAMDVKTSFPKYHLFKAPENIENSLAQSIKKIISSQIPYEFRTTCVPGLVTEEDIYFIAKMIKGANKHCLQQFRPHENTLDEKFSRLKPYNKSKLDRFKSISENFVENVIIRGI